MPPYIPPPMPFYLFFRSTVCRVCSKTQNPQQNLTTPAYPFQWMHHGAMMSASNTVDVVPTPATGYDQPVAGTSSSKSERNDIFITVSNSKTFSMNAHNYSIISSNNPCFITPRFIPQNVFILTIISYYIL